jgi:hypothetical protein
MGGNSVDVGVDGGTAVSVTAGKPEVGETAAGTVGETEPQPERSRKAGRIKERDR